MKELKEIIKDCKVKITLLNSTINVSLNKNRIDAIDAKISNPDIWNDRKLAASLIKEREDLDKINKLITNFNEQISFYKECVETFPEELNQLDTQIKLLYKEVSDFEFKQMLSDPLDSNAAILTINAGAGGLEAANWVNIILRMYLRYADIQGFSVELLDMNRSEDHSSICIDSVSIRIEGKYAFGFLKGESGVHRLIRNSPFNSGDARHTSFAAVAVVPDIEDTIDIKIEDKDLEITAQTAGGPGGQNVNKVCSAIRIKHIPSGITIFSRTERDQPANKKIAMKILRAKLYDLELKKRNEEKDKYFASMQENSFGGQIRTYTLSPYTMVKDHRTNYEDRNADNILDGNIQEFAISYLLNKNIKQ